MNQDIIKIRKTVTAWIAYSPDLILRHPRSAKNGEGATVCEAIGAFFMENANAYGIRSIHYDMADAVTEAHVTINSVSNTKIV